MRAPGRVGIKIGPMNLSGPFLANAETLPGMEYVMKMLERLTAWRICY